MWGLWSSSTAAARPFVPCSKAPRREKHMSFLDVTLWCGVKSGDVDRHCSNISINYEISYINFCCQILSVYTIANQRKETWEKFRLQWNCEFNEILSINYDSPSSTLACMLGLSGSSGGSSRGRGGSCVGWREASRDSQRAAWCLHPASPNPQRAGESDPTLVRMMCRRMNTYVIFQNELSSTLSPLFLYQSGRRARGSQTSTCPEKRSS